MNYTQQLYASSMILFSILAFGSPSIIHAAVCTVLFALATHYAFGDRP